MTEAAKVRSAETAGAVRVKVCGLRRLEDVAAVNAVRPDYAGWIFVPGSRRQVTAEQAAGLRERLDPAIVPVGVFRDAPVQQIARLAAAGVIAVAQLHGDEDAVYIASLRALAGPLPVVKAVSVTGPASVRRPSAAAGPLRPTDPAFPADCLLFDNGAGGSGQPFDLSLISQARQADALTEKPFFIAGG
ncbi:MAG: phosphoribosylanthranilate isomerase, partial [Propionibacteriaceae bacterium]|nr:phosphoribosylanthranilate isomerase [Propionibacteriaceae bacterium]